MLPRPNRKGAVSLADIESVWMQADQNGVHIGKDGWLFLAAGSNEAMRLLTDKQWFVEEDAHDWALKLAKRQYKLQALGAQYVHMWIPDKIKVYREQLGFDSEILAVDPPGMVYRFAQQLNVSGLLVDPLPELLRRKEDGHLLYWKTDTHWTYFGACAAYEALCGRIEAVPVQDLWERPIHYLNLTLDLGSKLEPSISEQWGGAQILREAKLVQKNGLAKFLDLLDPNLAGPMLRGTSVRFENPSTTCDQRRLLIFGDSFSEYRPHLLTGLLAETFREVLFVWSTAIDYELVKRFSPDIVVTEMAERFIKKLPEKNIPDDGFDQEAFVLERITAFLNEKCSCDGGRFTWQRTPA